MGFIGIPAEQTTAFTDLLLAFISLGFAVYVSRSDKKTGLHYRTRIWTSIFLLLSFSAAIGAVAHGFEMSDELNELVWHPLNLGLGLTIAFFIVAVINDILGERRSRRMIPVMVTISMIFFIVTVFIPGSFLVFIIYEALAMLASLGSYCGLYLRKRFPGSIWIAIGILITIIAAGVQASEAISFTIIWDFDHNGLFHMIQMIALPFLAFGMTSLKKEGMNEE